MSNELKTLRNEVFVLQKSLATAFEKYVLLEVELAATKQKLKETRNRALEEAAARLRKGREVRMENGTTEVHDLEDPVAAILALRTKPEPDHDAK